MGDDRVEALGADGVLNVDGSPAHSRQKFKPEVWIQDGNPASPVPTTPTLDVVTSNYCLIFSSDSKHQREVELLLDTGNKGSVEGLLAEF